MENCSGIVTNALKATRERSGTGQVSSQSAEMFPLRSNIEVFKMPKNSKSLTLRPGKGT